RGVARPNGPACDIGSYELAPINVPAGQVPALVAAINTAESSPGPDVIKLEGGTYTLTTENNSDGGVGFNGLPVINSEITLVGNGATIQRSSAGGTPNFRIFYVDGSATFDVRDLTIRGGVEIQGAGIRNFGLTILTNCAITGNASPDLGGGIHDAFDGKGGGGS